MRKALRYVLMLLAVIAVAAGGFAAFVALRGIPKYTAQIPQLKVESTPERIARGHKLTAMLCNGCHLDPNTGKLTGRLMNEAPQFGSLYSKNITQHPEQGIGKWSDAELVYLLRTGIKPDGTYLPIMAKLSHSSDEDIFSIVSFLRSNHAWLQADNTRQPDTKYSFLAKFLCTIGASKPADYPTAPIADPDTTNAVTWGRYIVNTLECYSCHSRDFAKNDYIHPEKSAGFLGGGNEMIAPDGSKIKSRNLTMDEETGIGKWTEAQFVEAVKYGKVPSGPALRLPMAPYTYLTDNEAKAIYAYLKTVPQIKNAVERN